MNIDKSSAKIVSSRSVPVGFPLLIDLLATCLRLACVLACLLIRRMIRSAIASTAEERSLLLGNVRIKLHYLGKPVDTVQI